MLINRSKLCCLVVILFICGCGYSVHILVIVCAHYRIRSAASVGNVTMVSRGYPPQPKVAFRNWSAQTNSLNDTRWSILEDRRRQLRQACENLPLVDTKTDKTKGRILVNTEYAVSMCYVPKAGCTFWKRVFISLQYKHVNISQLDKVRTHLTRLRRLDSFGSDHKAHSFLSKSARLIFVRDPYTRLYSGYIDKLFLSEFWLTYGTQIVKRIRPNAHKHSLQCGHDVTFEEFLRHVLYVIKNPNIYRGLDEHWVPITWLCDPCSFDYHIIGKQETFSADRDFVFSLIRFPPHTQQNLSSNEITKDGIQQAIDISWSSIRHCVTRQEIARRLWQAYKGQGYIHSSIPFPADKISAHTKKGEFFSIAMAAYQSRIPTKEERNQQRRDALVGAYRTVSTDVMNMIKQAFEQDFQLFDYSPTPDYLREFFFSSVNRGH